VRGGFKRQLADYEDNIVSFYKQERRNLKKEIEELKKKNGDLEQNFSHEVAKETDRQVTMQIDRWTSADTTAETNDSKQVKRLTKTNNTMDKKLKATDANLNTARCTIEMHKTTIDQLKKKFGDEVAQKVGTEADAIERSKKLQDQLKDEKTTSKGLEERLTTAEGTIDGKNMEISSLNKKIFDLEQDTKKTQQELGEERTASKVLRETLAETKGAIDGKNNEISSLNTKFSDIKQDITKMAADAEVSVQRLSKLEQELTMAETTIAQVTEQRDGAQREITAKQAEIDGVKAKLYEKKRDIASMDEQLATMGPENYVLTQQLEESQKELASCHKSIGEKDQTIKYLAEFMFPSEPSAEQAAIDAAVFELDQSSQAMAGPVVANSDVSQQQQNVDEDMTGYNEAAAGPSDSAQMQGDIDHSMSEDTGPEETSANQSPVSPAGSKGKDSSKDTTESFDPKASLDDPAIQSFNYNDNGMNYYANDQGQSGTDGSDGPAGDQDMGLTNDSNGAVANHAMSSSDSASNAPADCNPTNPDPNAYIDPQLLMMDNLNASSVTNSAQGLTPSTAAPAQQLAQQPPVGAQSAGFIPNSNTNSASTQQSSGLLPNNGSNPVTTDP
jgi:predicted  nucleic acid-binding Zn-ribbon protein